MITCAGEVRGGADGSYWDSARGEEGLPVLHRSDCAQGRHQQRAAGMGFQGFCCQLPATESSVESLASSKPQTLSSDGSTVGFNRITWTHCPFCYVGSFFSCFCGPVTICDVFPVSPMCIPQELCEFSGWWWPIRVCDYWCCATGDILVVRRTSPARVWIMWSAS